MNIPAIKWLLFSAAATITAFLLPVFVKSVQNGYLISPNKLGWLGPIFGILILVSALYHGLYRVKTVLHDLGVKKEKIISVILSIVFLIFTAMLIWLIFS